MARGGFSRTSWHHPVRFREMVEAMYADGVRRFIEVGPGGVLTKLIGRCLGDRPHLAVSLDDKKTSGLRAFWRGLGRLAADGVELDLATLGAGYRVPEAPAEAKPHQILITGANHEKPYPPAEGAAGLPSPNPERPEPVVETRTSEGGAAPIAPTPPSPIEGSPGSRPAPAAIAPTASVPAPASPADTAALARMHHATIDAHRRFQEVMAESHRTFLAMASDAMANLNGASGVPGATRASSFEPPATLAATAERAPAVPSHAPSPAPVVPAQAPAAAASQTASPPTPPESPPPAAAPVTADAVTAAPVTSAPAVDTTALALEVVSEKTGYPVEMLDLDMEMEAGLGIDSIKQVEILSELQERVPGLPEIAPSELASLRTLRDVADKLTVDGPPAAAPVTADAVAAAPVSSAPAVDTTALALEVVSEKTGYPVEMLDLDMEMEAGLGIDSIKQVEILSELQERVPGLPEIAPSELASLRTLRDVAEKLTVDAPPAAAPVAADAVAAAPVTSAPAVDTTALALEVVSEKTGYPVEMLDLDMEMEAGLGIDSIKQVEILSELQERVPGLPEIAPSELASLRTLRDVAEKLTVDAPPAAAPVAADAVAAAPVTSAPAVDTTALALEVVSEKTGYPVEMLDLDMEMEAGLGIDSIKQVEILSELQERVPGLPEIAPSELASLRTLRDVADKLRPAEPSAASEPEPVPDAHLVEVRDVTAVSAFVPTIEPELRPGFGLAALSRGATVQVTNELPALAAQIAEGLEARGVKAEVVDEVTPTAAVICLAGLLGGAHGPEASLAAHTRAIAAARVVAQHPDPSDRLFVTVQATGGDFGLEGDPGAAAWLGGLPGIVKTAAREWPGASLKAIDVEEPDNAAAEIVDELFHGGRRSRWASVGTVDEASFGFTR